MPIAIKLYFKHYGYGAKYNCFKCFNVSNTNLRKLYNVIN